MSNKMHIFGLTGSYASGKSSVAQILTELGAYIIDADLLAREVVAPGSPAYQEIINFFGNDILLKDGQLNRKKLSEIIFNNTSSKKKLEEITHPKIRQLFLQKLNDACSKLNDQGVVFYVVPLLFESSNKYPELEKIVVVSSSEEDSIRRIIERDKCSRETAEKKYYSQIPIKEKEKKADYVIFNNSNLSDLETRTKEVFTALTTAYKK